MTVIVFYDRKLNYSARPDCKYKPLQESSSYSKTVGQRPTGLGKCEYSGDKGQIRELNVQHH